MHHANTISVQKCTSPVCLIKLERRPLLPQAQPRLQPHAPVIVPNDLLVAPDVCI